MREERFYKAQPLTNKQPVESVMILIDETLPDFPMGAGAGVDAFMSKSEDRFLEQAERLADALHTSLPQGMFDRLVLEFMRRRVSMYYGIESTPQDRKLIDWLGSKKETIELCYRDGEGYSIDDLIDNSFRGEDGSLRGALLAGYLHDQKLTEGNHGKS